MFRDACDPQLLASLFISGFDPEDRPYPYFSYSGGEFGSSKEATDTVQLLWNRSVEIVHVQSSEMLLAFVPSHA